MGAEIDSAKRELNIYRARMGLSVPQLADRMGLSRKTMMQWAGGFYKSSEAPIARVVTEYVRAHPVVAPTAPGRLYGTRNVKMIDEMIARAQRGEWCLAFGAPGTQKSFVFETRLAESYSAAGEAGIVYVYASARMSPSALLKEIARGLGALAMGHRHQIISNILHALSERESKPGLVIDEAHHLDGCMEALELLREVGDRGRVGMVVAGHDDLENVFKSAAGTLEQWRSRFDRRERLPGLTESEVEVIARGELGELGPTKIRKLIDFSRATHRGSEYLSARALFKMIGQLREAKAIPAGS